MGRGKIENSQLMRVRCQEGKPAAMRHVRKDRKYEYGSQPVDEGRKLMSPGSRMSLPDS